MSRNGKDLRIVRVFESDLFCKDKSFDDEDEKFEYYNFEFWQDSDFISFNDNHVTRDVPVICVGNEIIIRDEEDLSMEVIEMILRFYGDEWERFYTPLWVGTGINFRDDRYYKSNQPKMWYLGNRGYHYYCHQYNFIAEVPVSCLRYSI